jgi:hypothetical protein
MTTRAELRALVRDELNDAGASTLWPDALLDEYLAQAIREYSRHLPEEASTTITVVADQAAYDLPVRFVAAKRVEQPEHVLRLAGERQPHGYRVYGGKLILSPAPSEIGASQDVRLEYLRGYAEPAVDGDALAIPTSHDDVLVALVCARALRQISADEAKRQRFERVRGADALTAADSYQRRAAAFFADLGRMVRVSVLEAGDE